MGKKRNVTVGATEATPEGVISMEPEKKKKDKYENKKKGVVKPLHGKKYKSAAAKVEQKPYELSKAVALLKKIAFESFNASVELHVNLMEEGVKGEMSLPHGTGKEVRVAVFDESLEKSLANNEINFDVLLARPDDMKKLVRFAKLLGPKGLMPTPKKGTVTQDVEGAIKKFKGGAIHYKSEPKFPLLHQVIGSTQFTEKQLEENLNAILVALGRKNIQKAYISSTMSPSIPIDLSFLT